MNKLHVVIMPPMIGSPHAQYGQEIVPHLVEPKHPHLGRRKKRSPDPAPPPSNPSSQGQSKSYPKAPSSSSATFSDIISFPHLKSLKELKETSIRQKRQSLKANLLSKSPLALPNRTPSSAFQASKPIPHKPQSFTQTKISNWIAENHVAKHPNSRAQKSLTTLTNNRPESAATILSRRNGKLPIEIPFLSKNNKNKKPRTNYSGNGNSNRLSNGLPKAKRPSQSKGNSFGRGQTTNVYPLCSNLPERQTSPTTSNNIQEASPCQLPGGRLRGPGGIVVRPPASHPIVQIHVGDRYGQ